MSDMARLFRRLRVGPGCWEWTGGRTASGYGTIRVGGRDAYAHRFAWAIAHGQWSRGCVLHRCDNRLCVRPSHLFEGTRADNSRDMMAKRRHWSPAGDFNPRARLRRSQINDIRNSLALGLSAESIGRAFGVSHQTIRDIASGRTWGHVPPPRGSAA